MTRWARANNAHRKQPSAPTAWEQLQRCDKDSEILSKQSQKLKRSGGVSQDVTSKAVFSLLLKSSTETKPDNDRDAKALLHGKRKNDSVPHKSKKRKEKHASESPEVEVGKRTPKTRKSADCIPSEREREIPKAQLSVAEKKRLRTLRKQLSDKGLPRTQVWNTMRREKSKSLRSEKRRAKTCFKCRQFGHVVASCPNANAGTGICFRCGSTEHTSKNCKSQTRTGEGSFPFATCFVCGEQGHLSSACPDNPDGLYPNGGCCHECGSVKHLRKDCPDLQKDEEETNEVVVHTQDQWGSADAEIAEPPPKKKNNKGPKVIAFK